MKLFVCLILVAIIFVVLGCDTPDGETGLTESEKVFIDRAWATGALKKKIGTTISKR